MPQIIACEWTVIFSENLLHKTVYPLKDPWGLLLIESLLSVLALSQLRIYQDTVQNRS